MFALRKMIKQWLVLFSLLMRPIALGKDILRTGEKLFRNAVSNCSHFSFIILKYNFYKYSCKMSCWTNIWAMWWSMFQNLFWHSEWKCMQVCRLIKNLPIVEILICIYCSLSLRLNCVEGCRCPPHQVLDDANECVPRKMCECSYKGLTFKPNYKEVRPGNKFLQLWYAQLKWILSRDA